MGIIKVMIAASEELHEEKMNFSSLIEHLNEVLAPRGIELKRVKWNPETDGTLNDFKAKLRDCEMCLTLYWRDLTGNSEEELNTAYQELKDGNNPRKLYVFFKESTEKLTESLKDFKANFVSRYGHFFCKFENVDTMNLQFILQLEAFQNKMEDDQNKLVSVKARGIMIGGKEFVNLDNIPFAALNKEYLRMKDEVVKLDEQVAKAEILYQNTPDDKQIKDDYNAIKNRSEQLAKDFEIYQNHLYDIALGFAKTSGERYSQRLLKARELFEAGNVMEADLLLNLNELKKEAEGEKKLFEQNRNNLEIKIGEFRMKADTVMTNMMLTLQQRIDIVCEAYEEAISIAVLIRNDEKRAELMLEYAQFCREYDIIETSKKYYMETIAISHWLPTWNNGSPLILEAKAYNGLALLYSHQKMFRKAEEAYTHALAILYKIIEDNNDEINYFRLAILLNNLSSLHRDLHQYDKAQKELEEALRIFDEHNFKCEDAQKKIGILVNLISVCQEMNQYAKVEQYVHRAYKLLRDFEQSNSDKHCYTSLGALVEIGRFYSNQHRFREAEQIYKEVDQLFCENKYPEEYQYLFVLLKLKQNQSVLYVEMERYDEALLFIEQAKRVLEKLKSRNSIAIINEELALSSNSIKIYSELNDYDAVNRLSQEVFVLFHQLDDDQLEEYQPELAMLYLNKSMLLRNMDEYSEAMNLCNKALTIFRKLAESQPEVYNKYIAKSLIGLAIMFEESDPLYNYRECEKLFVEALEIYENMAQTAPDVYLPDVANTLFNLACFHFNTKKQGLALKELEKQQSIIRQFVDMTGHSYAHIEDLAKSLHYMGNIYEWANEDQNAVACLQESLSLYKMINETIPSIYVHKMLEILFKVAIIMEKKGQYQQAIVIYQQMEETCQDNKQQIRQDLLPIFANILYNKGRMLSYVDSDTAEVLSVMNNAKEIYQRICSPTQNYNNEIMEINDFIDNFENS